MVSGKKKVVSTKFKLYTVAVTIFVIVTALLLFFVANNDDELRLMDADTGQVYASYPMSVGQQFSVTFIHSVNKSPVIDTYEVREDGIWLVATKYYTFGAGVPTETEAGETLTYTEDGGMLISGMDRLIPQLCYVVGTVSDHTLEMNGEEISLRELCGKNSSVTFLW